MSRNLMPNEAARKRKKVNSRQKGARGERQWAKELNAMGFNSDEPARRGQQFSGSKDSPDVVCKALACLHPEVKFGVTGLDLGTKLLDDACEQAADDAADSGKLFYVAWKPTGAREWRVTFPCMELGLRVTVCGSGPIKAALLRLAQHADTPTHPSLSRSPR
jgi:Holliday junction resolvase